MRIAMVSPIAWRTSTGYYGQWGSFVSQLIRGLVKRGLDVTRLDSRDSQTGGGGVGVCPREGGKDESILPRVWECLYISEIFERGEEFDLIHNHFDYFPLTYVGMTSTPVLTTLQGFLPAEVMPVYKKYNRRSHFVSISDAERHPELDYIATIYPGIDLNQFSYQPGWGDFLLFFSRFYPEEGAREAIEIARRFGMKLVLCGLIQDRIFFEREVRPFLDGNHVVYTLSVTLEERKELLGGAYALLHFTNFGESFGLSVVEAMACGTPVVAFRRGSIPELIVDEQTGFLVSSIEEAVIELGRVKELDRAACRKWVEERFTADRMVEDYIRVYEKILSGGRREDHRPWGYYSILEDKPDHKVKRIVVYPGQRLSLQRHRWRNEYWYIFQGRAVVTRNEEQIQVWSGQAVNIPRGAWHRIMNPDAENLTFIEIQTGDYFGEADIERKEDDYGRVL